jgi:hypothetical protein
MAGLAVQIAPPDAEEGWPACRATHASPRFHHHQPLRDQSVTDACTRRRPSTGLCAATGIALAYCTAFIMSKIGRYIATTMPPTTTPSTTIMIGSSSDMSTLTAASTSSS